MTTVVLTCNPQQRSAIVANDRECRRLGRKYGATKLSSDIDEQTWLATHRLTIPDAHIVNFWRKLQRRRAIRY